MKALSMMQPWAWATIRGFRNYDNRTWESDFKGEFFIHASLTFDHAGYRFLCANYRILGIDLDDIPPIDEFIRGYIVGVATIDHSVKIEKYKLEEPWLFGPVGYKINMAKELVSPIKCKGANNFFNPPLKVQKQWLAMLMCDAELIFKQRVNIIND